MPIVDPSLPDHLLALLVGLVLPAGAALRARRPQEGFEAGDRIALYWSNSAVLAVLAALVLGAWEHAGRGWAAVGLAGGLARPGAGLALAAGLLALYALDTARELAPARIAGARARFRELTPFLPTDRRELAHYTVLAFSAAVFEEIAFRGHLVSYLSGLLGEGAAGRSLAVLLPAAAFGIAHAYQGAQAVLKIFVSAAGLGWLYLLTGSLWLPIGVHLVVDLVGGLVALRLAAGPGSPGDPERPPTNLRGP